MAVWEILIPVAFVAGLWGYILLNFASNNRRILQDDILSANEKRRKEAESSQRAIRLLAPILLIVVVIVILFVGNALHPFIRLDIAGVALFCGGFLFAYIGWAVGLALMGSKDDPNPKDARKAGIILMISFMTAGIIVMVVGVLTCMPQLALSFL